MTEQYPPPPYPYGDHTPALTQEERIWALSAHIGTLVSAWFALGIIAPIVTLVAKGDSSAFVRRHSVESLNFQISLLIYGVVGVVAGVLLTIITLGLALLALVPLAVLAGVAALVVVVLATIKASNGEDYRYPLTLRFVK